MRVIIAGGGMADATLALVISRLNHGALPMYPIEAATPESHTHPGFDERVIALATGTYRQLACIGVWQPPADCAAAITTAYVSDCGHAGFVILVAEDYQLAALGQAVESYDVRQRLFALLRKASGVMLYYPDRVANVVRTQSHTGVILESSETLMGRILIAVDGIHSALTAVCGVDWQQEPHEQLAVIASIMTSVVCEGRAFKRLTQHDPLAILSMSGGRCSLIWCHSLKRREKVLSWSDEKFCCELQSAFGWRLGKITHAGKRSVYPLALACVVKPIIHRTAPMGNAAQTLHPIAGQGSNLGMRDVMSLAETLTQTQERREDMGDYGALCRRQQRRQSDRKTIIGVTDSFVHLFANRWTPLAVRRNIGLITMELLTPACDVLAQRVLGRVVR